MQHSFEQDGRDSRDASPEGTGADPNTPAGIPPIEKNERFKKEQIIEDFELAFDSGDSANGSLYICQKRSEAPTVDLEEVVSKMRNAQLWSERELSTVPDEHRQAYKEQLELVSVVEYESEGGTFLISRFDHPKFPSNEERWSDWQRFFDSRYSRGV